MIKMLTFTIGLLIAVTASGYRWPGQLQRQSQNQADRYQASPGRIQSRHPALFHDGEFHHQPGRRFNRCSPDHRPQYGHDRTFSLTRIAWYLVPTAMLMLCL